MADNYFPCSNDIEVVRRGKGLWKFVKASLDATDNTDNEAGKETSRKEEQLKEADEHMCYLALAHMLTSVNYSCKLT